MLATKYHCPVPPPDLIARPQVTRLLDAGLRGRLTLISAPAGFGKTTLVAQWLTNIVNSESGIENADQGADHSSVSMLSSQFKTAWLSLDADDNTLPRFWAYVIAALQTVAPDIGRVAQAALQAPQSLPIEPVLTVIVNDLVALNTPLLLVLDDYHVITLPEIHRSVDLLLDHLPERVHLVIITREDPPLALARLRARGQLSEIRAADLRFSAGEAAAFLNTTRASPLSEPDIATLVARTEGWITGLRLAALSLQHTADQHAFVAAFSASDRFLTDYLLDEVLSRQPPHRKAFLLQTSILNQFCGSLCDAVLGIASGEGSGTQAGQAGGQAALATLSSPFERSSYSQQILDELDRANLFLVPLDHERRWFRYHHLFAEFLRLRLREAEPELLASLYRRASAWCAAHALPRDALSYALAAGDHAQAADLLEALIPAALGWESVDGVLAWLAALPAPLLRQRPLLCTQFAWALTFAGRLGEAAEYLAMAETGESLADSQPRELIAGYVAAHRAYLYFFQGEFAAAQQAARQALAWLPATSDILRVRTAVMLSSALRLAGELQAAEDALSPLADRIEATGSVYTATLYHATLGVLHQERGQLHQAMERFNRALAFATRVTGRPDTPFTGFAYLGIGHVQRAWNELEAAAASLARGIALCREWRQADALAIGLIEFAELQQERGELALARQVLDELRELVTAMASPWGQAEVQVAQARLDLARGAMSAVDNWVRTSGVSTGMAVSGTRLDDIQTLGQVLVAHGDHAGAARLFERLADQLRAAGRIERLLTALVWRSRALAGLGRHEEAMAVLGEALALGEAGGYVRVFVAGGPPVAALLRRLKDGERQSSYIAQLLDAFHPPPRIDLHPASGIHSLDAHGGSPNPLVEPLHPRELQILRLMAAGLSNQAIGAELALSVNTVRWYASQLFTKLDVSGRGAAVARARELGLLP